MKFLLLPQQVELENPDYKRFPRLRDLRGFEALVGPGDLIFIPNCWWHQVETLSENSVSLTFWYKVRFGFTLFDVLRAWLELVDQI